MTVPSHEHIDFTFFVLNGKLFPAVNKFVYVMNRSQFMQFSVTRDAVTKQGHKCMLYMYVACTVFC